MKRVNVFALSTASVICSFSSSRYSLRSFAWRRFISCSIYLDHIYVWNIPVNANSSVYWQIRRIIVIGSLIAVGEVTISKCDIYEMITIPLKHSWMNVRTICVYLTYIEYDQQSGIISEEKDTYER